jgi:hypothetical protein
LESLDLQELIPHCLRVKSKIEFAVGNKSHKGQSYFKVLPRTLSMMLEPVWNHLMEEAMNDNDIDDAETEAKFDLCLKEFISVHSSHRIAMNGYSLFEMKRSQERWEFKILVSTY